MVPSPQSPVVWLGQSGNSLHRTYLFSLSFLLNQIEYCSLLIQVIEELITETGEKMSAFTSE